MPAKDNFQGVSNCYVFKSRLQEYAQKVGLPTPVYETTKEGPSHEPTFHSTVIVNDVRYNSLPGFSNRKAAEQSAAEVALMELSKSNDFSPCVSQPVHETGLCKNMLQEYAQKMNFAIPLYQCQKDDGHGKTALFSCTVEIGGIRYIGAVAKTKKEAEIKAARTALLAIQSCPTELSKKSVDQVQLTVIPCKRREAECSVRPKITRSLRAKKGQFKTVMSKRMKNGLVKQKNTNNVELNMDGQGVSTSEAFATGVQAQVNAESAKDSMQSSECGVTDVSSSDRVVPFESDTPAVLNGNFENRHFGASDSYQINRSSDLMNLPLPDMQTISGSEGNVVAGELASS